MKILDAKIKYLLPPRIKSLYITTLWKHLTTVLPTNPTHLLYTPHVFQEDPSDVMLQFLRHQQKFL